MSRIIGIRDSSELGVKEKREDAILIGEFCEKVRINGKDLLYPRSGFADGYRMHFKRKSERISYSYNGFELTTSREKSTRYDGVDCPQEQCKVPSVTFTDLTPTFDQICVG